MIGCKHSCCQSNLNYALILTPLILTIKITGLESSKFSVMADECLRSAISKLNLIQHSTRELVLKREQEIAVKELLAGKHVLAVLPTGTWEKFDFHVVLVGERGDVKV